MFKRTRSFTSFGSVEGFLGTEGYKTANMQFKYTQSFNRKSDLKNKKPLDKYTQPEFDVAITVLLCTGFPAMSSMKDQVLRRI